MSYPPASWFHSFLGQRIAERRKAQGITQADLAATLGIAQQTMAHYESGVSRIAVKTLSQLATALYMLDHSQHFRPCLVSHEHQTESWSAPG